MAWTHFTAPLAAGEELTALMWYELCEALAERLAVTGQTTQVDLTVAASIRDARVACRGVPISTSGGAAVLTPWTTILVGTQASWAEDTTTTSALSVSAGNSFVTSTQWGAEGLTESEWGTLITATSNGWNDRRYWNIIRATIQRLQRLRLSVSYATDPRLLARQKTASATGTGWAACVTSYGSAGETSGSAFVREAASLLTIFRTISFYEITGRRTVVPFTLPSVTPLSSAEAWSFVTFAVASPATPVDTLTLDFAGATNTASAATGSVKVSIGTGLDARGTQSLDATLGSYAAPTTFEPTLGNDYSIAADYTAEAILFIAPTWAKP